MRILVHLSPDRHQARAEILDRAAQFCNLTRADGASTLVVRWNPCLIPQIGRLLIRLSPGVGW